MLVSPHFPRQPETKVTQKLEARLLADGNLPGVNEDLENLRKDVIQIVKVSA